jgi:hypothetical protein
MNTTIPVPDAIVRLDRDLRAAAAELSEREARYLVDAYYAIQDHRIEAQNQVRSLTASDEPNLLLGWLFDQHEYLETEIKKWLDRYSSAQPAGAWAKSITGIGPVIAAGLLAHIDITRAPSVGHIWSFAGLNPERSWGKGEKRPWNARLKTLCWKIGESFVKVSGRESDIYGKVWIERKEQETLNNLNGDYAQQATETLQKKNIGKTTEAWAWYSGCLTPDNYRTIMAADASKRQGLAKKLAGEPDSGLRMHPPARIHARAKRYATKLFLAHLHHVMYEIEYGTPPPKPYVLEHGGHVHFIAPPNWKNGKIG